MSAIRNPREEKMTPLQIAEFYEGPGERDFPEACPAIRVNAEDYAEILAELRRLSECATKWERLHDARTRQCNEIDRDKVSMHASILIVLERLRSQENTITPSLLVIRECVRELRRYEPTVPMPTGAEDL